MDNHVGFGIVTATAGVFQHGSFLLPRLPVLPSLPHNKDDYGCFPFLAN